MAPLIETSFRDHESYGSEQEFPEVGRSRKVLLQIPVEVEPEEGEGEELVAEGAKAFVPQHRLEKEVLGGVSQEQLVVPQLRLLLRTTPRAQNVPAKRKKSC